jgi:hypothetical protein
VTVYLLWDTTDEYEPHLLDVFLAQEAAERESVHLIAASIAEWAEAYPDVPHPGMAFHIEPKDVRV